MLCGVNVMACGVNVMYCGVNIMSCGVNVMSCGVYRNQNSTRSGYSRNDIMYLPCK
jgi:hypothetical protein